nr:hypothetical protein [Cronobacter dublinensis]
MLAFFGTSLRVKYYLIKNPSFLIVRSEQRRVHDTITAKGNAMKKSEHIIDGRAYQFQTENGITHLVHYSYTRPVAECYVETVYIPSCKIITRANGDILFALELNKNDTFEIITAQSLYDRYAWQWFEPLAENFHRLVYINNAPEIQSAYKHFSWQDIIDFAETDRPSFSFASGMPGDWKVNPAGADGYLLVMIDGKPYWADAIGQIPFAVDTYRATHSIEQTLETGKRWADGTFTSAYDDSDTYDNFFVLRGALYASKRFTYRVVTNDQDYPRVQVYENEWPVSSESLSNNITAEEWLRFGKKG